MLLKKCLVAVSFACSLASGVANAAVVNFYFTGTVTYGGSLAPIGSPIAGTFSYDTDPGSSSGYSFGNLANYNFVAPFGISANVGGHAVTTGKLGVSVWNDFGGNVEDMVDISGNPVSVDGVSHPNGSFGFRLASKPGSTNVLTSTALPLAFDVTAFDAGSTLSYGWLNHDGAPGGTLLQFSVNSIVSTVPLPTAAWLLGSGLLGLIGIARKRKTA